MVRHRSALLRDRARYPTHGFEIRKESKNNSPSKKLWHPLAKPMQGLQNDAKKYDYRKYSHVS